MICYCELDSNFLDLLGCISINIYSNFSADYVAWNGANPDISVGRKVLAKGPNPALLIDRTYKARGSTNDLCKGAKVGLAKGSIYGHRNVACN